MINCKKYSWIGIVRHGLFLSADYDDIDMVINRFIMKKYTEQKLKKLENI